MKHTVWQFFKTLNIYFPHDSAIPVLGIYPPRLKTTSQTDICALKFTAALFTIAKTWIQPQCPSTDEWINKMWYMHTMEYYLALKKEGNPDMLQHE